MTALRRIGGPNAITGWSFALTAVVFAIATLLPTTRDRITGPAEPRLAVAMLATGAAFAVLVLARATVLRGGARPPRPVVALAVFALAGVVQALALMALRPRFGLVPLDPGLLIATRAAAGVVWLSIVAILVDEVRSHNERVAELTARIGALREVRDREDADREATVRALRDETLDPLRRALDAIGQSLGGGGGAERARAEADRVRRLVEDEVRPASHALLDREADAGDRGRPAILARRARLGLVVRLAASSLAAPTWLAVGLPLVIAMLFALQGIGLAFALVVSLSWVVVMSICFRVGRRVLEPRLGGWPVRRAAAVLVAVYAGFAVVGLVNNWFWGYLSPLGRWLEWPSLFVLPAFWIGIALSRAAQAKREETEARLAETASELAVAEARRLQLRRHEYQRAGRLLHGEVQGSLLAVARRLEAADALPATERAAAVDEAAVQLRRLADRLGGDADEGWTAERALADLSDLWSGAVDVRIACAPATLAALDRSPATRTSLIDVVAEAISNAVRHGGATVVEVRIAEAGDGRLALEVDDDGRGGHLAPPGKGAELLDAVSPDWSLETGEAGGRLRAAMVLEAPVVGLPSGA